MKDQKLWVVRVPKGQDIIDKVSQEKIVAIGFGINKNVAEVMDRGKIKDIYRTANPEANERRVSASAGQMFRFAQSIKIGDWVLTPDRDKRTVLCGKFTSEYFFSQNILKEGASHYRKVEWSGEFSRDSMSTSLKNSIGALSTVFNMDKHQDEILKLIQQPSCPVTEPGDEDEVPFYEETKSKADELIADLISEIDPYRFQDLVAGLLKVMGYKTSVSEPGPDHGIDIFAHPDAFGFVKPRIKVQVKRRQSTSVGHEIRALIGTLDEGENGLFVSTGGFTTEAKNEARRNTRITLLDMDEFVKLLTENYHKLDSDYKIIIPLRKVWIPTS